MRPLVRAVDYSYMKSSIALTLLAVSAASCNLVDVRLPFGVGRSKPTTASGSSTGSTVGQAERHGSSPDAAASTRGASRKASSTGNAAAPARQEPNPAYETCVATFNQNYEPWLKLSAPTRKAMEQAHSQSPYAAMATLLHAWEMLDDAAAVRQSGQKPVGAIYFQSLGAEMALQMFGLSDDLVGTSCINTQLSIDYYVHPDGSGYYGAWTGNKDADLAAVCGGPTMAQFRKAEKAQIDYINHFNQTVHAERGRNVGGGVFYVKSMSRSKTSDTLVLSESYNTGKCVEDGTYVHSGNRIAKGCTWVYGKTKAASDSHTYHFAPAALPLTIKVGDELNMAYEIDPDAPATTSRFKKEKDGGKWGVAGVQRNGKSIYYICDTKKHRSVNIYRVFPGGIRWNAE